VPFLIGVHLVFPVLAVGGGHFCSGTSCVPVPKAAMNEYRFFAFRQNDVRGSRKLLFMKPVSVTHGMQRPPDGHLRRRVLGFYRLHDFSALLGNVEFRFWHGVPVVLCYPDMISSPLGFVS